MIVIHNNFNLHKVLNQNIVVSKKGIVLVDIPRNNVMTA